MRVSRTVLGEHCGEVPLCYSTGVTACVQQVHIGYFTGFQLLNSPLSKQPLFNCVHILDHNLLCSGVGGNYIHINAHHLQ